MRTVRSAQPSIARRDPAPVWLRPALFFAPLSLLAAFADLPASFVQEYTLERRFGLSDQTPRGWLEEYAKSALIAAALTGFLGTLLGAAIRRSPRRWPWLASLGTLPLFVAANVIVPLYVMPLFNAFEPVEGSLEKRLRKLAARFGVGDAAILRMDMSRQTRKANAFVTGIGHTHRIVLGDTLIDAFPENETEFVVAHELGHYVQQGHVAYHRAGRSAGATLFLVANAAASGARARAATAIDRCSSLASTRLCSSRRRCCARFSLPFRARGNGPPTGSRSPRPATPRPALRAFRRLRDQNLADEDPPRLVRALLLLAPVAARAHRGAEASLTQNGRGAGAQPRR